MIKKALSILPVVLVLVLVTTALLITQYSTNVDAYSESTADWLNTLNLGIFLLLVIITVRGAYSGVRRLRSRQVSGKFTLRLIYGFMLITLLPLLVVAIFSFNFLNKQVDSWFSPKIESALEDSLALSRRSLDVRQRQYLNALEKVAVQLAQNEPYLYGEILQNYHFSSGAYEIALLRKNKQVLEYVGDQAVSATPNFPTEKLFWKLAQNGRLYQLETLSGNHLYSRVAITLSNRRESNMVLTALYKISESERSLAQSVQQAQAEYSTIAYQRDQVKNNFRVLLFYIIALVALTAIWAAFMYSRKLSNPIRHLFNAILAVAGGDLKTKLKLDEESDFLPIASAFNTMTGRLYQADVASQKAQDQERQQNVFLNEVIKKLTSGIIIIEGQTVINTNQLLDKMLGIDAELFHNKHLMAMAELNPELLTFYQHIAEFVDSGDSDWQAEISFDLNNQRKILVCKGAGYRLVGANQDTKLIVVDDITQVLKDKQEAIWSEMARYLAHEIKNPLTPIQLSAERLQHKLADQLDEPSRETLSRLTKTIINQVSTMQSLVNAFSEYAKTPQLIKHQVSLQGLINEVMDLYQNAHPQVQFKKNFVDLPRMELDAGRMRQLLTNLLKNAAEAVLEKEQGVAVIEVSTALADDKQNVTLTIADNGGGIDDAIINTLFEPYVTSKTKGTGLGLTIVNKIVQEHGGNISVNNLLDSGGVAFIVELPLAPLNEQSAAGDS